ncbi:MAG: hypothetical protein J6R22_03590 [Alphaproteobacteria bacterium]|nr:hypothetical protein [Alphaproteobacteria bacterium]
MAKMVVVKTWLQNNKNTIIACGATVAACIIMMVQCGRISDLEQAQQDTKGAVDGVKSEVLVNRGMIAEGNEVGAETNGVVKRIDGNVKEIKADVDTVKADVDTVKTIVKNCCAAKKPAVKPASKPAAKTAVDTVVVKHVCDTTVKSDSAKVMVEVVDSSKNSGVIIVDAQPVEKAVVTIANGSENSGTIIIGDNNVVMIGEPVAQKKDTVIVEFKGSVKVNYSVSYNARRIRQGRCR